jgi:phosphonate transport system substrate-binding protein
MGRVVEWCRFFIFGAIAVTLAGGCGEDHSMSVPDVGPAQLPAAALTIGSVSLNPAQEHDTFQPLADYLARHLRSEGIGRGRVEVVDSLSMMVEELDSGRVDIYIDSPFPVAFVQRHAEIKILLQRLKRGAAAYRSVLFTRADGGIDALAGLRGRMVAFGEPFSTTGYLLPKAALASAGFNVVNYADPAALVPGDEIGYVFSNDAENTMIWVLKSKVTAGAVNEDYFEALAGNRLGELKVLHRSDPVPRNIVCARGDLDVGLIRAVVGVLLSMDEDAEGRAVLNAFEQTARFEPFPDGGLEALSGVMELLPFVEDDLGQ